MSDMTCTAGQKTIVPRMLLTATEVAKVLAIGRSKVYEMIRRGELPVIRIGTSVRVPAADLDRWVRSQTMMPEAA